MCQHSEITEAADEPPFAYVVLLPEYTQFVGCFRTLRRAVEEIANDGSTDYPYIVACHSTGRKTVPHSVYLEGEVMRRRVKSLVEVPEHWWEDTDD
jgi:hypothetical protein